MALVAVCVGLDERRSLTCSGAGDGFAGDLLDSEQVVAVDEDARGCRTRRRARPGGATAVVAASGLYSP